MLNAIGFWMGIYQSLKWDDTNLKYTLPVYQVSLSSTLWASRNHKRINPPTVKKLNLFHYSLLTAHSYLAQTRLVSGKSVALVTRLLPSPVTTYTENCFQQAVKTAAVFLDLPAAYDTVWHTGLLYKLS